MKALSSDGTLLNDIDSRNENNDLILTMSEAENPKTGGEKIAVEQIAELREIEGIRSIHLLTVGAGKSIPRIAEKTGLLPRPKYEMNI